MLILKGSKVLLASSYIGSLWASKILTDWGCQITKDKNEQKIDLVISDVESKSIIENLNIPKIILKDISISSSHILALSGNLSTFGQGSTPFIPKYLSQIVISNSLAIYTLQTLWLIKYKKNSQIKQVYLSVLQLVTYFGAFNVSAKLGAMLSLERGKNTIDGGAHFYAVYQCQSGFISVGNLQPKFYNQMLRGMNLPELEKSFLTESHFQMENWPKSRQIMKKYFLTKSASYWQKHFSQYDTCVTEIKKPFKSEIIHPFLSDLSAKL